jgi:4-amino-4-deoxy-L-arabinose transferase-like glycosyltransferase
VLIAYLMIRLLKADDPRWWLGIGVAFGLGLETKYTILVWAAAVAAGVILTRARRHLSSPWLWAGAALALLLFLPNLIWQAQHDFISLDFMRSIHARDIRIGRTADFIPEQLLFCANPVALPLWAAGLTTYLFLPAGKRYRLLGWMAVIAFGLLVGLQGRSYYFAPVYPMLIAQGAVTWHKGLARLSRRASRLLVAAALGTLAIGAAGAAAIALPIAPINSELWRVTSEVHDIFVEQVGWPELVETVADIYNSLPAEDRQQAGILTGNYGEAGAINLYGPAHGLPEAISGVNSYWLRGHGDPPPQVLIVLDWHNFVDFEGCELAGSVANRFGVRNEETGHPTIYICRQLRQPWPVFWQRIKSFA